MHGAGRGRGGGTSGRASGARNIVESVGGLAAITSDSGGDR